MISTKGNVSQEEPDSQGQTDTAGAALKGPGEGGDAVTSVSVVDREHGCFTVQLGDAVVRVLKERAEAWNDTGCATPRRKREKGAGRLSAPTRHS